MRSFERRRPLLRFGRSQWSDLIRELERRGAGRRESGAFLLATRGETARVARVAYYDDLDPTSLTGGVDFHAEGYQRLSEMCRQEGLQVIGDVHTHPSNWVSQSDTDSANPMVALKGHVALIVPHFSRGRVRTAEVGVARYGAPGWECWQGREAARRLRVGWLS